MLVAKSYGAAHTDVQKSQPGDDEKTGLAEAHGEPKPNGRSWVAGNGVASGTTKVFVHSLPCEDDESEQVASSEPEVALICRRDRPIVRKTTFGL